MKEMLATFKLYRDYTGIRIIKAFGHLVRRIAQGERIRNQSAIERRLNFESVLFSWKVSGGTPSQCKSDWS